MEGEDGSKSMNITTIEKPCVPNKEPDPSYTGTPQSGDDSWAVPGERGAPSFLEGKDEQR